MIGIVLYLIALLFVIAISYICVLCGHIPDALLQYELSLYCVLSGGLGGILYCLRGVYLNYSVRKTWSKEWYPWYIIRPIVSLMTGGISFLFFKAGLLVLEANVNKDSTNLGFYALAFIAGLNVDKFISKVEDLAQAAWGIEKTRASKESDKN